MLGLAITIVSLFIFFWGSIYTSYLWLTGVILGIAGCSWMAYVLIKYGAEHRAGVEMALAALSLVAGVLYARTSIDPKGPGTLQIVLGALLALGALVVLNSGIQANRKGEKHGGGHGHRL
jgi:peptidoglycan/LPS O-acetylase OafA/YrhL